MTYKEAKLAGWKDADIKYQSGYVSRKTDPETRTVLTAKGNRKGQLYVLLPCYTSTRYCLRQYLTK